MKPLITVLEWSDLLLQVIFMSFHSSQKQAIRLTFSVVCDLLFIYCRQISMFVIFPGFFPDLIFFPSISKFVRF